MRARVADLPYFVNNNGQFSTFRPRVMMVFYAICFLLVTNPASSPSPLYPFSTFLHDIWSAVRPYRGRFFLATFLRAGADITWLYPAYAIAEITTFFSTYRTGESLAYFWWIIGFWVAAVFIRSPLMNSAKYFGHQLAERASLDAQLFTIDKLFRLDFSWHEKENAGNKLKRAQNGGSSIKTILRVWFNTLIEVFVNFVGMLFIIATFDRFISALLLVYLVIFYGLSRYFAKFTSAAAKTVNEKEEIFSGFAYEAVNNIRTVNVLAMQTPLLQVVKEKSDALFAAIRRRVRLFQTRNMTLSLFSGACRLGTFAFIAVGISQGRYEVGFLLLFHLYFSKAWELVDEISNLAEDLIISKQSIRRMKDIWEAPILIPEGTGQKKFPAKWEVMSVKDLSFSYGDREVLNKISFDIRRGERIGVVGLSGAGKSTLFKLLMKESEEYTGSISFDGVSLKKISKKSYYDNVAVVLQETEVFNFPLRENITLANPKEGNNKKMLEEALSISRVTNFIPKLPLGLETPIGEKGVKLSGGEKQRVGIARAIFKQPDILLMDEATSHLDIESEEEIRESLHAFFQTVTAIVIAHRLTTIKEMDRIIVMEGGRIVESGSFDELYAAKGRFFELWQKQKL